uniref:Uncharacterized protein n=1 Tax=Theileria annulata TaxID=5874 RepID=A0A3B0MHC5_THEAN
MSERESMSSVRDSVSHLEEYMYHMNELYTEFPNKHDSENDLKKSVKSLKDKIKFNPRFHGVIQLVGLFRDRGLGNKQGFLNYNYPPFLLTFGYFYYFYVSTDIPMIVKYLMMDLARELCQLHSSFNRYCT